MTVAPADLRLTAAQRVAQGAGLGEMLFRRWLAAMLDLVVLVAMLWVAVYGAVFVFGVAALGPAIWAWLIAVVVYFPITEGLWGCSLGKYAASIVVIDDAGRPPGVGKALIRTFVGVIEINPVLLAGVPALITIALSKDRQRLGDIAAQTYVVPSEALARALEDPASVFD
jgi:uncharacterized RDD family membrane protein YckC